MTQDLNSPREKPRQRSFFLGEEIMEYIFKNSTKPDSIQEALVQRTATLGRVAAMQIAPDQGAFLSMLTALIQPTFAVEVGTFTGYSALAIAKALPDNGRLLCCDVSEEWTDIAKEHWAKAGVADRIDLVIAPAIKTLGALSKDKKIDFAFIDADKNNYLSYYEAIIPLLSENGLIAIDNVLWSGRVTDLDVDDEDTCAIRNFNEHVTKDERVSSVMLSIGDGLTLVKLIN